MVVLALMLVVSSAPLMSSVPCPDNAGQEGVNQSASAETYPYLVFETADGTKTEVSVESLKITVNGTQLTAGTQQFTLADLTKMYFSMGTENAVTLGDANGDGKVDIVDVTSTISYILGQQPANFVIKAADVNRDNEINIVDVTTIIDLILGQGTE